MYKLGVKYQMGTNRTKKNSNTYETEYLNQDYYVDGNTIRQAVPEQKPNEIPETRPKTKPAKQRPKKELSSVNKGACLVLIVAIAITLFVCIDYIQTVSTVSLLNNDINQMEKDLTSLKEENKIRSEKLNAQLDLEEVYTIATEEYGMVRPDESQVIYFDKAYSEFVKQYDEIP